MKLFEIFDIHTKKQAPERRASWQKAASWRETAIWVVSVGSALELIWLGFNQLPDPVKQREALLIAPTQTPRPTSTPMVPTSTPIPR